MSDIKLTIKQKKWRWLGHTLRIGHDDITNQALTWIPPPPQKKIDIAKRKKTSDHPTDV